MESSRRKCHNEERWPESALYGELRENKNKTDPTKDFFKKEITQTKPFPHLLVEYAKHQQETSIMDLDLWR